jgi:glucose/arabinose dehydrogenase
MMRHFAAILLLTASLQGQEVRVHDLAGDLMMPVDVATGPGRSLLIVLLDGRVLSLDADTGAIASTPVLDLRDRVDCCDNGGLLSFVLHPRFESTGLAFALYVDRNGDTALARFSRGGGTDPRLEPASERILLVADQNPDFAPNHHGGELVFGPDGFLYISIGDGGSANFFSGAAQQLHDLRGKLLRIDVDRGDPYAIPPDNPFVGVSGARPEIWARGLRNPWRFSFDPFSGALLMADIGQERFEEVNVTPLALSRGANFGWPYMEGKHCFLPAQACNDGSLVIPQIEYGRADGCSITGGHMYRGSRWSRFRGLFLYGDWCSGKLWGLDPRTNTTRLLAETGYSIVGFGEDAGGELYLVGFEGRVGRITDGAASRRRSVAR